MSLLASSGEGKPAVTSCPEPVEFGLNRTDLAIHQIVWVSGLTTFFGFPIPILWILEPQEWRIWLLFVLAAMLFAAFVSSTPRSIHAWLTRRPPVIIGAHGISVGFRETIPWTAVSGLYVGDERLSLKLTLDEMDRRGWDPVQGMAMRRVDFDVPLTWINAEPREIMSHAEPFLAIARGNRSITCR